MKTRLISAVLAGFAVLVMASCGGGSSDGSSTTTDNSPNVDDTNGEQPSGQDDDPGGGAQPSDGDNNAFDIADIEQFRSAMQKTWSGACFAEGDNSYRLILSVTADRAYSDFHDYEGPGCKGVPVGYYYPLLIESYTLGNLTTAASGESAREIDWTVVQQAAVGGENVNQPVGQLLYDTISYNDGLVLSSGDATTEPENRPNELEDNALVERVITSDAALSAATVQGVWVSNCHRVSDANRRVITTTINQDTATDEHAFYASDDCSGEPYAVRQDSWTSSFGETYLSVFGDTLIAYDKERVNSEILSYDAVAASGFEQPGLATVGASSKRYDSFGVEMDANGPVLMTTYCVIDDSSVCEKTPEGRSNVIDYNWSVRWTRP